ncbi:MAG: glycosyltransferase family 2 protein [Desulfobacterales bacterium]|jgi:glycosyltransferase involved in cell wall biosynthesis
MSKHTPFTACLITFNEEDNVIAALESIGFADEIIVIDSHSTDGTRELARGFRGRSRDGREIEPRVIERDWPGHVEQKNFAIDQAQHDWVFCLDADERVSPRLRKEIETELAVDLPEFDGYTMPRKTYYLGRWILRGGWYPDQKLRLFRRSRGRWTGINPHDHVKVQGRTRDLEGDLYHFSYRNIADHLRTINFFTDIASKEKQKRSVRYPLARMLIHPPYKFFKMYFLKQGFREGIPGFIIAIIGMFYVFLKYAKLWEVQLYERTESSENDLRTSGFRNDSGDDF